MPSVFISSLTLFRLDHCCGAIIFALIPTCLWVLKVFGLKLLSFNYHHDDAMDSLLVQEE